MGSNESMYILCNSRKKKNRRKIHNYVLPFNCRHKKSYMLEAIKTNNNSTLNAGT